MMYRLILATCYVTSIFAQTRSIVDFDNELGPVNLIKPDITKTKEYAKYAASSLCSSEKLRSWSCKTCASEEGKLTDVNSFRDSGLGIFGYVGVNKQTKSIILSYRDTVNLPNIISDLLLIPVSPKNLDKKGIKLHGGFYTSTRAIFPQVRDLINRHLNRNPDFKVIVVGHSLGGAMASISTVLLHQELKIPFEKMELYTYGQPRTGNHVFANYLNERNMTIARVTAEGDPIVQAVPQTPIFVHHHSEIFLPEGKKSKPRFCSTSEAEDPNCSNQDMLPLMTANRHFSYFGLSFSPSACK